MALCHQAGQQSSPDRPPCSSGRCCLCRGPAHQGRQRAAQPDADGLRSRIAASGTLASMKAPPPPVASTKLRPCQSSRWITRRSPSRNAGSPNRANSSAHRAPRRLLDLRIRVPERQAPCRSASRRPIEVFPAPISPTSTTLRPCNEAGRGARHRLSKAVARYPGRPGAGAMLRVMVAKASTGLCRQRTAPVHQRVSDEPPLRHHLRRSSSACWWSAIDRARRLPAARPSPAGRARAAERQVPEELTPGR